MKYIYIQLYRINNNTNNKKWFNRFLIFLQRIVFFGCEEIHFSIIHFASTGMGFLKSYNNNERGYKVEALKNFSRNLLNKAIIWQVIKMQL